MRREGSRNSYLTQRIPADVRPKVVGMRLAIPVGDSFVFVALTAASQAVRCSLRTSDPSEVKARQGVAAGFLESVWQALRQDAPIKISHRQATAVAGELYRVWADQEGKARSVAMQFTPGVGWERADESHDEVEAQWQATVAMWEQVGERDDPDELERNLGPLVDRLLLTRGIRKVDSESRGFLLRAFWLALRDAFRARWRNAEGDYAPDPAATKFPEWEPVVAVASVAPPRNDSLKALVEDWWVEAQKVGRKFTTYESYRNTMAKLVGFLGHDSISRTTPEDLVRFKDFRLQSGVSAKTVKDSDLAGLKTIFGWAVANRRASMNPIQGLTIKVGKPRKLRSKGFTEAEARAILTHAQDYVPGKEASKLAAAKRWVPWLCAFTGARVGEMLQLRKRDVRRDGKHWVVHITPEAGPVKTDEARDVVLHAQVIDAGFSAFVTSSNSGYLFISPKSADDLSVRRAAKTARNKVNALVREVVADKNVDPSHGWRHRFKTIGIEQGVAMRVLDAIQGHAPRNASEDYGDVTVKSRANAIARFPHIKL